MKSIYTNKIEGEQLERFLPDVNMRKQCVDTIRLKLIKIAAKVVKTGRYIYFKLCSSCPYQKEFYETLNNIKSLVPQLE